MWTILPRTRSLAARLKERGWGKKWASSMASASVEEELRMCRAEMEAVAVPPMSTRWPKGKRYSPVGSEGPAAERETKASSGRGGWAGSGRKEWTLEEEMISRKILPMMLQWMAAVSGPATRAIMASPSTPPPTPSLNLG